MKSASTQLAVCLGPKFACGFRVLRFGAFEDGFRVLGFRVQGLGFRGLGFRGLGFSGLGGGFGV